MIKNRLIDIKESIDNRDKRGKVFGRTLYVIKSTATGYEQFVREHQPYLDGTEKVYTSVKSAVDAAQSNDQIIIAPGVYDEGAEIALDVEGLRIFGSGTTGLMYGPCSMKQSAANHHIFSIEANGIEIAGLGFIVSGAYNAIDIDHTAAVYKTHVHDCFFTGTYGIYSGGTFDSVDLIVEDCSFLSCATAGLYMNGSRNKAVNNTFWVPTSGIGIQYVPTTTNRGFNLIANNLICGTGTTDTGIQIDGTPTAGQVMITENKIFKCNTTITAVSSGSGIAMNNYTGASTGAITVIDTDTD